MKQLNLRFARSSSRPSRYGIHFQSSLRILLVQDLKRRLIALARFRSLQGDNSGVSVGDAWRILDKMGHDRIELGPAIGALFRGTEWQWSGEWERSEKRLIRKWRLR